MLTALAIKHGTKLEPLARAEFHRSVSALPEGEYVITVAKRKAKRSVQANRRYWALLTVAARELGYDDIEELHEGVAYKLLKQAPLVDGLPRRKRTPALTTAEFADYVEAVERFFRVDLGIDLSGWEREL